MNERALAARALVAVETQGAWASVALDRVLRRARPGSPNLVTSLVYGVLRNRSLCDALLEPHLRRPLVALDPPVRAVTRCGAYELVVARRPPHAVVSSAVDAVRSLRVSSAAGLVNAVLRRLDPDAALPVDPAVRYSMPRWIVDRLAQVLGPEDVLAELEALNVEPPVGLRPVGATVEGLLDALPGARRSRATPDAVEVTGGGAKIDTVLADGRATVQDPASVLVGAALPVSPGDLVVDVAAAPGGKATHLAQRGARVLALDVRPERVRRIVERARILGLGGALWAVLGDGRRPPVARADALLVDAPCSGRGTLGRRPDLRWRADPARIPELVALQDALLDAAAGICAPGGRVLYAVCTWTPEETGSAVEAFRSRHPDFEVATPMRQTWAHREASNGMFYCVFRRH